MIPIAISLLWVLVGALVLAGVIYLAILVVENFFGPLDAKLKKGLWLIYLILVVIYVLMALTGHAPVAFG